MAFIRNLRPAGARLFNFFQSGLGEEVAEGMIGGGLVGLGLLHTDQPIEQTALQTALAMAGGVGLGMGARRIGAGLGKAIHPQALAQQNGPIASLGRLSGQQGVVMGARDSMSQLGEAMRKQLRGHTMGQVKAEFLDNPVEVARKFGMTPEQFKEVMPLLEKADEAFTKRAGGTVDEIAGRFKRDAALGNGGFMHDAEDAQDIQQMLGDAQNFLGNALTSKPTEITGEHIGRMVGRGIGDEMGIMGGVALGGVIGDQLGWESEKDRKIKELERELGR